MIGGALRARGGPGDEAAFQPQDMFVILDGGRSDVDKPFVQCFTGDDGKVLPRSKRTIYLTYAEDAPNKRLVRGFTAINQVERMLVLTQKTLTLQDRPRLIYKGTNRGNSIGDLITDTPVTPFTLTREEKRHVYGPHNTLATTSGGPGGLMEVDEVVIDGEPELDTDILPVFFHTMPLAFYKELLHSFCGKGVVHLTCGNGELALACVERKVPYVGICFTEQHVQTVSEYLTTRVYEAMQREDHPLYQASMVVQLATLESEVPEPARRRLQGQGEGEAEARPQPAGKGEGEGEGEACGPRRGRPGTSGSLGGVGGWRGRPWPGGGGGPREPAGR